MKSHSLTRALIAGVLFAELLCAVVFSGLALEHEMHGRRHGFDVMLRGRADSLLGAIQDAEDRDDNVIVDPTELMLPREDAYAVTMESGRVVGQSPGLSAEMRKAFENTSASRERPPGYFNFTVDGHDYRALRQQGMRVIDREEQQGGIRRPVTIVYAAPTAHLWHETVEAVSFYVLASCVLLLVTGIAITWFLRRSLSPLRELAARAEQVSTVAWEFHPPAGVLETRELEPIAVSIQKLLTGLRGSFERQRQFTGDAAHELKTSLAVLKSSLQLLLMRERSAQEYQQSIEGLLTDTQRMEELTNRMLTLARVEQAPLEDAGSCEVTAVLTLVAERLGPAATQRGVSIVLQSEGGGAVAMDSHDAELLFSNLLMNSVQHGAAGSAIEVGVREVDRRVEVEIRDHGDGIPAEALPHVFERFYRADPSRSRANGGAGLGLAICKAIVERYRGTIGISSGAGDGTTVRVSLPGARADEVRALKSQD